MPLKMIALILKAGACLLYYNVKGKGWIAFEYSVHAFEYNNEVIGSIYLTLL